MNGISPGAQVPTSGRHRTFDEHPFLITLLVCYPLALVLSWSSAADVWRTGVFANTDDATRMVQIRDWLAGQAWFDLSAHRMGLPQGLLSHWSRVVDVPVAALMRLSALALPSDLAERAARIAYPLVLQAGLISAMAYAASVVAGRRAALAAGLLIVFAGVGYSQFEPGRVHHHSPQILLLTLSVGTMLDSLDPARARRAAWSGFFIAVSLAIGLENLPFVGVLLVIPIVAWIILGAGMRWTLWWFSISLAAATLAVFVATVPPWRYGVSSVDALSLLQLVAVLLVALVGVGLGSATPHLPTRRARFAAAAVAGALVAGLLVLCFPEALHGPFYGMDPLLRPFWLDEVEEVRPLFRLLREDPDTIVVLVMPMLVGALGAVVAVARSRGPMRLRWAALLPLLVAGFAGTVWGIRVASSLQPLALLGAAWLVARSWDRAKRDGRGVALILPVVVFAASSSLVWAMVPIPSATVPADASSCLKPEALAPLAGLAPGVAFAPIDAGPYLLAHTGLSVLAGPYHRDNAGNHAVIAGFLAPPDAALDIVRKSGARYVMTCGHGTDLERRAAPHGLAAALDEGRVPAWLTPVPLGPTPFRVYAVD
ncbi:MAG: hypothetical protein ACRYGP_22840 [Janthinobacterium lividum]